MTVITHAQTQAKAGQSLMTPETFANEVFRRVAADDLALLSDASREHLAAAAYDRYIAPRLGTRIELIDSPGDEFTVLEIVNDDMPFLLDSTLAELTDRGIEPRLVAHPVFQTERDSAGRVVALGVKGDEIGQPESFIHIHLPRVISTETRESLIDSLRKIFNDVRTAVADWRPMRAEVEEAVRTFKLHPPPLAVDEVAEAVQFLEWMLADNYIFMGMRAFRLPDGEVAADPLEGSGLGILRDPGVKVLRRGKELVAITPEVRAFLREPVALIITKASVKSRIHRRAHMDYVGVKLFDTDGHLIGELSIVGLFTSTAYYHTTREIPYLRHKVARVVARAGFAADSHSGNALTNVLESYPRDELFQLDVETLFSISMEILSLTERPRLKAIPRLDRFDRFVSVLVFIPKDRYDTSVRRRVGAYLADVYKGRLSAAYPAYPEGPLARTHFIIGRDDGETPAVPRSEIEAAIAAIVRTWSDDLETALAKGTSADVAHARQARYRAAFGAAYREAFTVEDALEDIAIMDRLNTERPRAVDFYRKRGDDLTRANLKVFALNVPMPLSERVPLLEGLGFTVVNERTYRVVRGEGEDGRVWLHDMTLERASGGSIDVAEIEPKIEAVLIALFNGQTESDGYNGLILEAGLGWREVAMLRTLSRYAQQIRAPFSQDYMWSTLKRHPTIAAQLVALFMARFDPRLNTPQAVRAAHEAEVAAGIEADLQGVSSLDEDRILRRFRNLIQAAVRTNFFQLGADGRPRDTIAFKFEAAKVDDLPRPAPLYEIFLHSPRLEGVHLRFGRVARGGIRWSDRPQDFRTEVLGLVKAQQVKNAVIVPVGAKGGFVPKKLPPASDRAAWFAEGTAAYRIFIGTLLELTDNLSGDTLVPPADTLRHDGDDPYLVVAADKGTATFSDTANAISESKGHWLGDAFASGGSAGYDHKKMGITARGAWEAVKRHFREMNTDIQVTPFTAVGVGDMSGDVFGNGMLLSPVTRLVAAFDHRDIFLDPNPDAATSFEERRRLFALPRSSWQDYDKTLISAGGGVFSRSAKSIELSPEIRAALNLSQHAATPQQIMSAILKAPVDLLWFGGIGTYVRASVETEADAGDRANDAIRITGADVRAKVIGEGANLGLTQRGRIEAARAGVRLNTDAIDNSAGVNSSDVEVNIKIALATPCRDGRLTVADRNVLLAEMTDDVAALVLRNNYLQSLAISLSQRRGAEDLAFIRTFMQTLESQGNLDRAVEYLPTDAQLAERMRAGEALTRPELAVLLAYAKLTLYDDLLASTAPDEPYFAVELDRYFPAAMRKRFPDAVAGHRLRREVIATSLANALINRGGPTLLPRVLEGAGTDVGLLAKAYAALRDAFGLLDINTGIDQLDGKVAGALQLDLYGEVQSFALSMLGWFVRYGAFESGLQQVVSRHRAGAQALLDYLDRSAADGSARVETWREGGVPDQLARRIASLPALAGAPDVVTVAATLEQPPSAVVGSYFAVSEALKLGGLRAAAQALHVSDRYERLALTRGLDAVADAHRSLTVAALAVGANTPDAVLRALTERRDGQQARMAMLDDIQASGMSVAKLSVAAGLLADLAR